MKNKFVLDIFYLKYFELYPNIYFFLFQYEVSHVRFSSNNTNLIDISPFNFSVIYMKFWKA